MPLSASIGDRMAFSTEATLDDFRFASYERVVRACAALPHFEMH